MSVTRLSFPYGEAVQWYTPEKIAPLPASAFREWLLSTGSLTKKLREQCLQFEVRVLGEGNLMPLVGELPQQQQTWVREVLLCLDGTPWVFARTLIPAELMSQSQSDFMGLGTRPLGELLFTSDQFTPGHIEACHFTPCNKLAALVEQLQQDAAQPLWGRRRYFEHHDSQLIVSEIFLPAAQAAIEALPQQA
ncbi:MULTISPECIES: chorismate--pyruvate lyase family protein [Shewanella]|uniref:chorismate--pyruvate lyase family protein n=1 Tax=Shewanella TaxID=22 RepID=UPI00048AA786|nr:MULTISPECIES: chorismate lyase [Shewanella]QLE83738.1 chorismate lyase [Shewanella sp. Scap07]